jgi:hypothetical protein
VAHAVLGIPFFAPTIPEKNGVLLELFETFIKSNARSKLQPKNDKITAQEKILARE